MEPTCACVCGSDIPYVVEKNDIFDLVWTSIGVG